MREVRYFYVPDAEQQSELPQEEAQHAVRVLRLTAGDEMFLMDGKGNFYHAEVTMTSNKHCQYRILETLPQNRTWRGHIHLAIAPTKDMGRIEWMVEKATEMGFDEITFLNCKFSERKQIRTDRIEKIVISAMKQSRKAWKPVVNEMVSFNAFMQHCTEGERMICHCYNEVERPDLYPILQNLSAEGADVTIMVGPEGDFSIDEVILAVERGWQSVTLGNSRLRTETAGLSAVFMANLLFSR